MRIAGRYSFNQGFEIMVENYEAELQEILEVIRYVDATQLRTKSSKEKTMMGKLLYSPTALNRAFGKEFRSRGWRKHRESSKYSPEHYVDEYVPEKKLRPGYREMDFVKNKVGVEVQLGKYSFMVYNVAAKMTIFHNLDVIDVGVEIVPVKELAQQMSSGVSYFEQFVWDLRHRGVADIDIPVLVIGIVP